MKKWKRDDEQHKKLETDAIAVLSEYGYETGETPYHNTMSDTMINRLHRSFELPSLLIRTRADRVAVHHDSDVVKVEAKTHGRRDRHDCTIEMLPLIEHIRDHDFCGSETIYIYRNPVHPRQDERGRIYAFYAHQIADSVSVAMIPQREENLSHMDWYKEKAFDYFGRNAVTTKWTKPAHDDMETGSGDPFVIIPERFIHGRCRTLQELLQDRAREKGRIAPARPEYSMAEAVGTLAGKHPDGFTEPWGEEVQQEPDEVAGPEEEFEFDMDRF
ncbi:MAG: hypothetical protein ACYC69_02700 [Thermodesulfovibrionales bacterium]